MCTRLGKIVYTFLDSGRLIALKIMMKMKFYEAPYLRNKNYSNNLHRIIESNRRQKPNKYTLSDVNNEIKYNKNDSHKKSKYQSYILKQYMKN